MFKVCFDFCHFLHLIFFFFFSSPLLLLLLLFYSSILLLFSSTKSTSFFFFFGCVCAHSFLICYFSFFFIIFFSSFVLDSCAHLLFLMKCPPIYKFLIKIQCAIFLSNKGMRVNLYKLYILCSHFFPQPSKKVFYSSNQIHIRKITKFFLSSHFSTPRTTQSLKIRQESQEEH